jgi:hypothetical protein
MNQRELAQRTRNKAKAAYENKKTQLADKLADWDGQSSFNTVEVWKLIGAYKALEQVVAE